MMLDAATAISTTAAFPFLRARLYPGPCVRSIGRGLIVALIGYSRLTGSCRRGDVFIEMDMAFAGNDFLAEPVNDLEIIDIHIYCDLVGTRFALVRRRGDCYHRR